MINVSIITTAFGCGLDDRVSTYKEMWENSGFKATYCEVSEILENGGEGIQAMVVGVEQFNKKLIDCCPDLKVACKFGVGRDNFDIPYAESKGIKVLNMPGINSESVAELAIAFMLDLCRKITVQNNEFKNGKFNQICSHNMLGKTIGIIGTGSIGCLLAKYLKGFGMRYLGYDVYQNPEAIKLGIEYVSLDELVKESDFISIHVPLIESTYHLINESTISKMKSTAVVINASRGGIVDDIALAKAVSEGKIYGAGLDVFEGESHHLNEALSEVDDILCTPHIAAYTHETLRKMECTIIQVIKKAFEN